MEADNQKTVKAVGLISGGLDSTLAARVVKDLGVDVHGVYFAMPWGCCDKTHAVAISRKIGIKLIVLQLDERYLDIVRKPKFGYGTAMNPCVDCRIHMFSRAAQYMRHIQADFVFTGEVLGQRPMSQKRHSMRCIEKATGLHGQLLRPLSAHLLEPTIVEREGLIDRSKLLSLSGRSRKEQYALAEQMDITEFSAPAGGCSLTHPEFARKMKDTLAFGYRNFRETISLKWGRHFRVNANFKIIIGRDEGENESLKRYAHSNDHVMQFDEDKAGATAIIKGDSPDDGVFSMAAGLIQYHSRYKHDAPTAMPYWPVSNKNDVQRVTARPLKDVDVDQIRI